jgi:type IV pilus assembly protein PilB
LVRAGLITAEQLEEALVEQARVGRRLGSVLVSSGLVSETQVTQVLSQQLSVPWVSLHHIDFSRELLNLVPVDLVERFCLIPIYVRKVRGLGDALYIAMDDPTNGQALADVAERSRLHVRAMIAPPSDIRSAIRAYYGIGDEPVTPPKAAKAAAIPVDETPLPGSAAVRSLVRPPMASAAPPKKPTGNISIGPKTGSASVGPAPATSGSVSALAPTLASSRAADVPTAPAEPTDMTTASRAPKKPKAGPRMIALTLLDGTTIKLPAKPRPQSEDGAAPVAEPAVPEQQLTARDLIAALRAASKGADASEVLGEDVRWEAMLAALLSVLLKKHLIADWEFVEEFKKG